MLQIIAGKSLWRLDKKDPSGVILYSNTEVPPYIKATPTNDTTFDGYPSGLVGDNSVVSRIVPGFLLYLQREGGFISSTIAGQYNSGYYNSLPYMQHHGLITVEFDPRGNLNRINITPRGSQIVSEYYKDSPVSDMLALADTIVVGQVSRRSFRQLRSKFVLSYGIILLYRDSSQQVHDISTISTQRVRRRELAFRRALYSYSLVSYADDWRKEVIKITDNILPHQVLYKVQENITSTLTPVIDNDINNLLKRNSAS